MRYFSTLFRKRIPHVLDRLTVRNMWYCLPKWSWEIAHLVDFYCKNMSWCTVLRMSEYHPRRPESLSNTTLRITNLVFWFLSWLTIKLKWLNWSNCNLLQVYPLKVYVSVLYLNYVHNFYPEVLPQWKLNNIGARFIQRVPLSMSLSMGKCYAGLLVGLGSHFLADTWADVPWVNSEVWRSWFAPTQQESVSHMCT